MDVKNQGGLFQPPSGGCVLKQLQVEEYPSNNPQPPSGGCVLKLIGIDGKPSNALQPPSGGCVLKHAL